MIRCHETEESTSRSCNRFTKHFHNFSVKSKNRNILKHISTDSLSYRNKSISTGEINSSKIAKPKKTTKSDVIFCKNLNSRYKINNFDNCGDTEVNTSLVSNTTKRNSKQNRSHSTITKKFKTGVKAKSLIHQHYKNENFCQSTDSVHINNLEKSPDLNTISEQSEKFSDSESNDDYFIINSDSVLDEDSNIENLKQFREENYFECHSAKSRLKTKGSVLSSNNHKCIYRFYLNDRLFPVPLNKDYNNNIRCMECHLPLDTESDHLNGTIQAKVKLNNEIQDTMILLPITKTIILKERRKEMKDETEDCLYFGIIKLNLNGDSMFNRNVPSNSFALQFQKGYKKYSDTDKYEYQNVDKNDVIII